MKTDESKTPSSLAGFRWEHARRRPLDFEVAFTQDRVLISTLEGPVYAEAGDAIITGVRGERWPVPTAKFEGLYEPVPPTRMGEDGTYRRRPVSVSTHQIRQPLSVALTDGRGVLLGNAGDWLVRHQNGSFSIVADEIFQQTYELMT